MEAAALSSPRVLASLVLARRLVMGVLAAVVITSLGLGGDARARGVFYALTFVWCVVLALCRRRAATPARCAALRRSELVLWNVAASVVLGEVALRAYSAVTGSSILLNDNLDAYRLTPGTDYGAGLRGNRLGYPGREFDRVKAPGVFRIAALGDSFAVGPAVPFAENYLTLLEAALSDTEVYNFGVSGAGPREYYAILSRDVWVNEPDLVLVSLFVGNDISETLATPRHLDPRQFALYLLATRAGRLARERWRHEAESTADRPARPELSETTFREVEARRLGVCLCPPQAALEKKWRQAFEYLERIVGACRQRRVSVAFVLIPDEFQTNPAVWDVARRDAGLNPEDLDPEGPQRRLSAWCGGRDVPCLDLLPAFRGVPDTYTPRDTHWNARGNRLAAARLAEWIGTLPGRAAAR
jgi:hypothetical protein